MVKRIMTKATLAVLLTLAVFLTGCSISRNQGPGSPADPKTGSGAKDPVTRVDDPAPAGEKPAPVKVPENKVSDYFPNSVGSTWKYRGEGNEYAAFTRKVLYAKGNRVQLSEDNGGTVGAAVFEITDTAVTRIFFRGEAYDGSNYLNEPPGRRDILLKAPLVVGTKWQDSDGSREIVDVNASVAAPAGIFKECIKVEIKNPDSTLYEYYGKGIGLIKREFVAGNDRITSTLEEFTVK